MSGKKSKRATEDKLERIRFCIPLHVVFVSARWGGKVNVPVAVMLGNVILMQNKESPVVLFNLTAGAGVICGRKDVV